MTTQPQQPDEFRAEDDIDTVLGHANPNPGRVGCPSREVLTALARRERPIGDPGYEHIVNCSPCYRDFRSFQQANVVATARSAQARIRWLVAAAAAVLLGAVGTWLFFPREQAVDEPEAAHIAKQTTELPTELDLRKYTVTRSDERAGEQAVLELPRARLDLTLLLPVGSEPGRYEVQILDAQLRSRASASGSAELRNYITTLRTTVDIHELPPGSYQLAVRRDGEEWQMFPARLQ